MAIKMTRPANSQAAPGVVATGGAPSNVAIKILINAALSEVLDMRENFRFAGLIMSAGWDAADIFFNVGTSEAGVKPLFKADGTEYSIKAAAGKAIIVPITDFMPFQFIQLRSSVNQTAERIITALGVQ